MKILMQRKKLPPYNFTVVSFLVLPACLPSYNLTQSRKILFISYNNSKLKLRFRRVNSAIGKIIKAKTLLESDSDSQQARCQLEPVFSLVLAVADSSHFITLFGLIM